MTALFGSNRRISSLAMTDVGHFERLTQPHLGVGYGFRNETFTVGPASETLTDSGRCVTGGCRREALHLADLAPDRHIVCESTARVEDTNFSLVGQLFFR